MVTLHAAPGVRLCRITEDEFKLSAVGTIAHEKIKAISDYFGQVKIGYYQIMPDHIHLMVHIVRDLPRGATMQSVMRGYKIDVKKTWRSASGDAQAAVFQKGMYHTLIFNREHLLREVAYVRDNVRRYRMLLANRDLFQKPQVVGQLADGSRLWGVGNLFLIKHPRRVRVQFSRSATEEMWGKIERALQWYLEQGYIFVSPFIAPFERRVLQRVIEEGGRAIRLTHRYFGERYKPMGELFDLCCMGRLLELSIASEFKRYARLDREACLRLNQVAAELAQPGEWW